MLPPPPELDPATTPDSFSPLPVLSPLEWSLIIGAFLLLVILLVFLLRKLKKIIPPPTSSQLAIAQIDRLMQSPPDLKTCSVQLSLILRSYLTGKAQDPALYETQQEFNRRGDALASIPTQFQIPVRDLLDKMSRLKYEERTNHDDQQAQELADTTKSLILGIDQYSAQNIIETDVMSKQQRTPVQPLSR
ncbi:MAG: hypothetical protein RR138_01570 [Akkermansia sp.]